MGNPGVRKTAVGFGAGAAFFGGVDGYLIAGVVGAAVGALLGALVGVGGVLLAWSPRPHDATSERVVPSHHSNYMAVWGGLFVLTALELAVAFVSLSKTAIILTLIALAVWKALLVAIYYMHLRFEPRRMWVLTVTPLPLALILVWTVLYEGW